MIRSDCCRCSAAAEVGVADLPTPLRPRCVVWQRGSRQFVFQDMQEHIQVRLNSEIGLYRGLAQLGGVHVHLRHPPVLGK